MIDGLLPALSGSSEGAMFLFSPGLSKRTSPDGVIMLGNYYRRAVW